MTRVAVGVRGNRRLPDRMTGDAQLRTRVVHYEEISARIVMGIMTSGALHFEPAIELDSRRKLARRAQFRIANRQGAVIAKRDGVIVGKIRADVPMSGRDRGNPPGHGDRLAARQHTADSDRAVVTTEAKL